MFVAAALTRSFVMLCGVKVHSSFRYRSEQKVCVNESEKELTCLTRVSIGLLSEQPLIRSFFSEQFTVHLGAFAALGV